MKSIIGGIVLLIGVLLGTRSTDTQLTVTPVISVPVIKHTLELRPFLVQIALFESDNNYQAVNKYGMLGKYQFHPSTIKILGFDVTNEQFLSSPTLQDAVMISYLRANKIDLKHILQEYNGTRFKGIRISESGVLAAAHFAGSKNVIKFFADSTDAIGTTDANGASIRLYLTKFADYNIGEL